MTAKREHTKTSIDNIWSDDNWSVIYGELRKGPGRSRRIKPLFQYVGEKIPFAALREVEKNLEELGVEKKGVYIAHDSMGTARYVGQGKIFDRLKVRKKKHPNELVYFSFFVVKDKQHIREVETLLIRGAGPLLEFNDRKKRVGIPSGNVRDYEPGTFYFERQKKKGKKKGPKA